MVREDSILNLGGFSLTALAEERGGLRGKVYAILCDRQWALKGYYS